MIRLLDPEVCVSVTKDFPEDFDFDARTWFADSRNRAYQEGQNVGFAEYKTDDSYVLHFCFAEARGRKGIDLARAMIAQLYKDTPATKVFGSIREGNKAARLATRLIGLTSLGLSDGRELFFHTRGLNGLPS